MGYSAKTKIKHTIPLSTRPARRFFFSPYTPPWNLFTEGNRFSKHRPRQNIMGYLPEGLFNLEAHQLEDIQRGVLNGDGDHFES